MGPSGSGKSTLLHLIAAMDRPTGGDIRVLGHNLRELNDRAIAHTGAAGTSKPSVFQQFDFDSRADGARKRGTAVEADNAVTR